MDCYWSRRLGGFIYQWASSRLFIPRGDNVFPLCIKWASRAFLTASRLLWTCWHFIYLKPLLVHSSWTMEQAYQAFLVRVSCSWSICFDKRKKNRNWLLELVNVLAIYWRKLARTSLASFTFFKEKKSPGLLSSDPRAQQNARKCPITM